jgi:CheY-like chemotaxis protein
MNDLSNLGESAPQAIKILLVEDSFENRDMLTRRLQRRGFTVCSAPDGSTGVAMAVSEKPDVILMDVALGEMDGWQATRLIKSDVRTSNVPIIALTAHALASDRAKSVAVGCADFDTKPVDLTRLLDKIQGCLPRGKSQLHQDDNVARQEQIEGVQSDVDIDPARALTGSVRDFQELQGPIRNRRKRHLCPFARLMTTADRNSRA